MIHLLVTTIDYQMDFELFDSHELAFAALLEKLASEVEVQDAEPMPTITTEQEARDFESDTDLGVDWILAPLFTPDQNLIFTHPLSPKQSFICPASGLQLEDAS